MWPQLSDTDLGQVADLIMRLYHPNLDPSSAKALQQELQQIQSAPHAWGLVTGLSTHADPNVRFFSAHTAQVKISRDWETLPNELHPELLKLLLHTLSTALAPPFVYQPANAVVVRKLFGSLASLMIRLPFHQFSQPIVTVLHTIESTAATTELPPSAPSSGFNTPIPSEVARHRLWRLEWCGICVEEIGRAGISAQKRQAFQRHIQEDVPAVMQCIITGLQAFGQEAEAASKCAEAWVLFGISGDELISLLPPLYALLPFPPAASAITEILSESVFRFGKGTKVLTEPLVEWVNGPGEAISDPDEASAFAKLLAALVEHSSEWLVARIQESRVQSLLRTILRLTAWEGIGGVDENISELTLPIYPLLQEAVMDSSIFSTPQDTPEWQTVKGFFAQLVQTVRGKVRWHSGMDKEDREAFETWRRDAGEVIVGAYYILRDDMLAELVQAAMGHVQGDWRDLEAVLHCIRFSAEAVPLGEDQSLPILFGQVLGRIGSEDRLRLTTVCLIQAYEEWFKYHSTYLLPVLAYLVPSLSASSAAIARYAADALKALCDMCRKPLVEHISSFSALHATIPSIGPEEQVKVIQGITSVIQALDPEAAVGPVEGIIAPIVDRLDMAVQQGDMEGLLSSMNALAACFKGLAPSEDEMFDTDETPKDIGPARERLRGLRERVERSVGGVIGVWQGDGEVADAISSLVKSSTAAETLISLSPLPLLSLVCAAAERASAPSSLWLALASTLTLRINSPPSALTVKKSKTPEEEVQHQAEESERWHVVADAATRLVRVANNAIGHPEGLKEHPDVVESWFKFCSALATRFPGVLLRLDGQVVEMYVRLGVLGLSAQERFSLTGTCGFFIALLANTRYPSPLEEPFTPLLTAFGPQLLHSLLLSAGSEGPRSVIPNLAELLAALVTRVPGPQMAEWLNGILAQDGFPDVRATGECKLRLKETVLRSRTAKKMREALNDFALVCRGLANTVYGNATAL